MSTQSLTDQLRLLEEEITKIEASGVPLPYTQTLLAAAKGLAEELNKAKADLLPHYAAIKAGDKLVDELSKERDALRAENERQKSVLLEALTALNMIADGDDENDASLAAEVVKRINRALASLSK